MRRQRRAPKTREYHNVVTVKELMLSDGGR